MLTGMASPWPINAKTIIVMIPDQRNSVKKKVAGWPIAGVDSLQLLRPQEGRLRYDYVVMLN